MIVPNQTKGSEAPAGASNARREIVLIRAEVERLGKSPLTAATKAPGIINRVLAVVDGLAERIDAAEHREVERLRLMADRGRK